MKRIVSLCLVALVAFIVFGRATCHKAGPEGIRPVQAMKLKDNVYYHNVGITYGNGRYYTLNGGNESWGIINVYDEDGGFVDSWKVEIDGRAIFYHPEDELLYVKPFGTDCYSVDPENGDYEVDLEEVFEEDNSSVGWSPGGAEIYELVDDGEVIVYESFLGTDMYELEIASYGVGHGYEYTIAVSGKYLFAWDEPEADDEDESDDSLPAVWVYTIEGEYIGMFKFPRAGFPLSLSWANGMLWIAEDADGSTEGGDGYWYGYRLEGLE